METGMLWFDNNRQLDLTAKIKQAAASTALAICFVCYSGEFLNSVEHCVIPLF